MLEVGDKALAMVGRTPNYISAIFPLKDGVISDHTMTRELICRFVKQVYNSHMVKPGWQSACLLRSPASKAMLWWKLWWLPVLVRCI